MSEWPAISPEKRAIKTVFGVLVKRCGGVEAAAAACRVSTTLLSHYSSMAHERFAPLDVVLDLEAAAGETLVTSEMARQGGQQLVPIDARAEGEMVSAMVRFAKECGDPIAAYGEALRDGAFCQADLDRLDRELAEVASAAATWRAALRSRRDR